MDSIKRNSAAIPASGIRNTAAVPAGGVTFYHPIAFWLGVVCVTGGVFGHLPMWQHAASMGYKMAGMPMDTMMVGGMAAIIAGIALAMWGLLPRKRDFEQLRHTLHDSHIQVHALDNVKLGLEHYKLFAVIVIGLIVDTMKPATLGFVMPGMASEYAIAKESAKWLPFCALVGTTVGSVMWGMLSDVIGRRSTILLSALIFIGTSICGAMPSFEWNLVMCFIMGMSAGGLLPIIYSLLAETVPTRHRGWSLVLLGGLGTIGGYATASWMSALLEPDYGWRVLWFLGLPTGMMLVALNRHIPESPRFLIVRNRRQEAKSVMERYGAVFDEVPTDIPIPVEAVAPDGKPHTLATLFRKPFFGLTFGLLSCGLAWSLVNWGFLLWLPTNLRNLGLDVKQSSDLIKYAVFYASPIVFLAAWLYHNWSTKRTFIVFIALTIASLLSFMLLGGGEKPSQTLILVLVMLILASSTGVISVLLPYSAEVYPNAVRGSGTGIVASSSKFGGIVAQLLGPFLSKLGLATFAASVSVPVLLAGVVLIVNGIETRGKSLEDLHNGH